MVNLSNLIDFEALNKRALIQYPSLLKTWLPGGTVKGTEYTCADIGGGKGNSFCVNITNGKWSEFAGNDSGGDPISLFALINKLGQYQAAIELSSQIGFDTRKPLPSIKKSEPSNQLPAPKDATAPNFSHYKLGEPSAIWKYADADGQILQYIARYDTEPGKKEFRPFTWNGNAWGSKGLPEPRPLYGLDKLAANPDVPVIICEGEKAADASQSFGNDYISIGYSNGTNAVSKSDWTPLADRICFIWPDADAPGLKAAEDVAKKLREVGAAKIRQLDVSEHTNGWDAADAVESGSSKEYFDQLISTAVSVKTTTIKNDRSEFKPNTIQPNFNPAAIPQRPWVIREMLMMGYITQLIAPPGVGKSMFSLLFGVMVATGSDSIRRIDRRANVLVINNEDDLDEMHRRLAGILQQYKIEPGDLTEKFHLLSGYGASHLIAKHESNTSIIAGPVVEPIIEFCLTNQIKFIIIDPFVSTHDANENDNASIEQVISQYRHIAKTTGATILLVHHISKGGIDTEGHAGNMNSGRGASALTGAVRAAFTLARMSKENYADLKLDDIIDSRPIRLDNAKQNFAVLSDKIDWYEMKSVTLANGDSVGVPVPFDMTAIDTRLEKIKVEEKTKRDDIKISDVASDIVAVMTEDKQLQGELKPLYKNRTGKKKTAAEDALALLPIGFGTAIRIYVNKVPYKVWREREGSNTRPYYYIHRREDN
jgi:RecA-family ATPase